MKLTPENAYVFAQIVEESGLPAGVLSIIIFGRNEYRQ